MKAGGGGKAAILLASVLVSGALAGCIGGGNDQDGTGQVPQDQLPIPGYQVLVACFDVEVTTSSGTTPTTIVGTMFLPDNADGTGQALVFVPGGLTQRHSMDGTSQGIGHEDNSTWARHLALSGWIVVSIDRLGIGDSRPDDIHGAEITVTVQAHAVQGVLESLRVGDYRVGGDCDESAPVVASHIVLAGHSLGGWISMAAAGPGPSVDAVLVLSAGMWGASNSGLLYQAECGARSGFDPDGYFSGFCDDTYTSMDCMEWLTAPHMRVVSIARAFCDDLAATPEPLGLALDLPDHAQILAWVQAMQPVPALMFIGTEDIINMQDDPLTGSPDIAAQAAEFVAECTCQGSAETNVEAGHVWAAETSYPAVRDVIDDWLDLSGLGPRR